MDEDKIVSLYKECFGHSPLSVVRLAGAGSSRKYYRVSGPAATCIATFGEDIAENMAFVNLSNDFSKHSELKKHFPRILAVSADKHLYLQSDFGDFSLYNLIEEWHKDSALQPRVETYFKLCLDILSRMQVIPLPEWIGDVAFAPFSKRLALWDLNYFKYAFLKPSGVMFDEEKLEDDFEAFVADILDFAHNASGFMYRDFQSRNIMLSGNCKKDELLTPGFIDYQGGRRGPVIYDAISLLWQAKAGIPGEMRSSLLEYYIGLMARRGNFNAAEMRKSAGAFILFRTLQVLGAYGFRGIVERKSHFLSSISAALANLREVIENNPGLHKYEELVRCCRLIASDSKFAPSAHSRLRVEVFSFSYKRGYPDDFSGNGGGFMFDCRGMHNPGRYEAYKPLTGMDKPVIDFLEERGEVFGFLENAFSLVDITVATYLRRGFSNLQVGFGCTGGRHRSVYCAEKMAAHLAGKFPEAEIVLVHREQGVRKVFNQVN